MRIVSWCVPGQGPRSSTLRPSVIASPMRKWLISFGITPLANQGQVGAAAARDQIERQVGGLATGIAQVDEHLHVLGA